MTSIAKKQLRSHVSNHIKNFIPACQVKACSRLVQNKHLRFHCKNSCNGNPSLLSP